MPLGHLLILGATAFVAVFSEVAPVGLLSQMSEGLGVTEALAGQLVTVFAFTAAITAIPLSMFVARFPRRVLLATILLGVAAASLLLAVTSSFWFIMAVRIANGALLGLLWSMLPGYVVAIVPSNRIGRGLAFIATGESIAFAFGPSLSAMLGELLGWRAVWVIGAGLAVLLAVLVATVLPRVGAAVAGAAPRRPSLAAVLRIPGLLPVLLATGAFILGHNIAFTYILPVLRVTGVERHTELVLLGFGLVSLVGVWLAAVFIDARLRLVAIVTTVLGTLGLILVAISASLPVTILALTLGALVLWGLAYGGAPALFQTVTARVSGAQIDAAQSVLVAIWNSGIGFGALIGGVLLSGFGISALLWVAAALLLASAVVVVAAKRHGFAVAAPEASGAAEGL